MNDSKTTLGKSLLSDGPTPTEQLARMKASVAAHDARDAAFIAEHGEEAYLRALAGGTLPEPKAR